MFKLVALALLLMTAPALAGPKIAQSKGPAPPTVVSERFTVQAPIKVAGFIGDMKIKGRVDSVVLAGTAQTYFSIDTSGNITVTTAGATAINGQTVDTTYTLTVTATNPGGTGTGQAIILAHPKPVAPPVVTNGNFTITAPVTAGQKVGTMSATGNPTSWAITGSTP